MMSREQLISDIRQGILSDIMSLFKRNDSDTITAKRIRLNKPYTIDLYDGNSSSVEIDVVGICSDSGVIIRVPNGEENTIMFNDVSVEDLIDIHKLFNRTNISYEF